MPSATGERPRASDSETTAATMAGAVGSVCRPATNDRSIFRNSPGNLRSDDSYE
jgi:hypothetical protein